MPAVVTANDVSVRFILEHQRPRSFQDALIGLVHKTSDTSEEFWALRGVSFEVGEGEALGIVGQNGSGKSNLLKLLTRILEPTSGVVSVKGKVSALIELGAGFHPDLTGRENIYLNGSILGFSRKQMNRLFDEIVSFSELERFIDTPVKHYSSGMYMRLGFSVAINVDPDILIIDEILAVGDAAFQAKCMDRINEFRRQGKTIIFVSHTLPVVEQLCDRVIWLQKGEIQSQGRSDKVIRHYTDELQKHDEEMRELAERNSLEKSSGAATWSAMSGRSRAEIVDLALFSHDGTPHHTFRTGYKMVARLRYCVRGDVESLTFRISLRRSDGLLIYSSSRQERVIASNENSGAGHVDIIFENLAILPGSYELVATIESVDGSSIGSNLSEKLASFSVWSDLLDGGIVVLPTEWVGSSSIEEMVGTLTEVGSTLELRSQV